VGEDRGTGGGKLDCCQRLVAAGLGSATRLTTLRTFSRFIWLFTPRTLVRRAGTVLE
jgi:hypothetical protein